MRFLAAIFIFALFFLKINALKCLVCDSIYQPVDDACQPKDCDEYAKEWLEPEDKNDKNQKFNDENKFSVKAYYHNMTRSMDFHEKKTKSENLKFFDTCISKLGVYDGKFVKMKACGRKEWDSCKTFNSCSTCETDYCNTLQCYSCDGDRVTADISQITPCKNDVIQNFCYGDYTKCFSATDVKSIYKDGTNVEYRGCIYKNQTQSFKTFFEKEAILYSFCDRKLCNEESVDSAKRTSQKYDNSSINTQRQKKAMALKKQYKRSSSDDDNKELKCKTCKDVEKEKAYCPSETCEDQKDLSKFNKKYNCVSANRTEANGKLEIYKSCTYEGSGICDELKTKGYDSCSTCDTDECNTLQCYECGDYVFGHFLSPCKSPKITSCDYSKNNKCFSAKIVLNGHDALYKNCETIDSQERLTAFVQKYRFSSHYFCDKSTCNEHDTAPPEKKTNAMSTATSPMANMKAKETTATPNVSESQEKVRSGNQKRVVSHLSATTLVVITMCFCLLF